MAKCPVCGMQVNEENPDGGRVRYQETNYYFCSSGCRATFQRHPQAYVESGSTPDQGESPYDPRMFMGEM